MTPEALASLRTSLTRWQTRAPSGSAQVLPLGIPALDAALPGGGLSLGGVTELQIRGASGAATSFALAACRAAQHQHGLEQGGPEQYRCMQGAMASRAMTSQRGSSLESRVWCAFIDPSASLFAQGVNRLGVDLSRLLVMRPTVDALDRVAVRIAEANLMAVLVIDLRWWMQPSTSSLNEHSWQRTVRRLSLSVKSSFSSVLLLTHAEQFQSLPLPTFQRLELTRKSQASFELKVAKERTGRISAPRLFPYSIFDLKEFDPHFSTLHQDVGGKPSMPVRSWEAGAMALTRKVS